MQRALAPTWSSPRVPGHGGRTQPQRLSWLRILALAVALSLHLMVIGWLARSDASRIVGLLAANSPLGEMVVDVAVNTPPRHASAGKSSAVPPAQRSGRSDNFRRLPSTDVHVDAARVPASASTSTPSARSVTGTSSESDAHAAGAPQGGADGSGDNPGIGGNVASGQDGNADDRLTIEKLRPIHAPPPEYPQHALDNSEQGVVVLLVRVGANGAPLDARIVKSSGFDELDQITLKKVLAEWRFVAATRDGVKVEALTLARQAFVLH